MELLKTVAMYAGWIITTITCLSLIIKPIRHGIADIINKKVEETENKTIIKEIRDTLQTHIEKDEIVNESTLALLRDNITKKYYRYLDKREMPSYERENLIKQYDIYHKMHGNSYIDIVYEEMKEWKVSR